MESPFPRLSIDVTSAGGDERKVFDFVALWSNTIERPKSTQHVLFVEIRLFEVSSIGVPT